MLALCTHLTAAYMSLGMLFLGSALLFACLSFFCLVIMEHYASKP